MSCATHAGVVSRNASPRTPTSSGWLGRPTSGGFTRCTGEAASTAEAAGLAFHAGIDIELPSPDCYTTHLLEAVASGLVDEPEGDRAVERVLRLKARLGLFREPTPLRLTPIDL